MSYMYEIEVCPRCGKRMWNGKCENLDCHYHWYPKDDDDCVDDGWASDDCEDDEDY